MITQTPISLKIDCYLLKEIDIEVSLGYQKRNRIINEAIRMYLDAKDTKRMWELATSIDEKASLYEQFNRRWFSHI